MPSAGGTPVPLLTVSVMVPGSWQKTHCNSLVFLRTVPLPVNESPAQLLSNSPQVTGTPANVLPMKCDEVWTPDWKSCSGVPNILSVRVGSLWQ